MTQLILMLAGEARSGKDTSADILQAELEERGYTVTRTYFAKALKESLKAIFQLTDEHVFGSLKETPMEIVVFPLTIANRIQYELTDGSLKSILLHMAPNGEITNTLKFAARIADSMVKCIQDNCEEVFPTKFIVTPRQLMQWWGTEAIRKTAYDEAWIDCVKHDIRTSLTQVAIVTDARFDNEVESLARTFDNYDQIDDDCMFEEQRVQVIRTHRCKKVTVAKHASEAGISDSLVDFEVENDDTLDALAHKLSAILDKVL